MHSSLLSSLPKTSSSSCDEPLLATLVITAVVLVTSFPEWTWRCVYYASRQLLSTTLAIVFRSTQLVRGTDDVCTSSRTSLFHGSKEDSLFPKRHIPSMAFYSTKEDRSLSTTLRAGNRQLSEHAIRQWLDPPSPPHTIRPPPHNESKYPSTLIVDAVHRFVPNRDDTSVSLSVPPTIEEQHPVRDTTNPWFHSSSSATLPHCHDVAATPTSSRSRRKPFPRLMSTPLGLAVAGATSPLHHDDDDDNSGTLPPPVPPVVNPTRAARVAQRVKRRLKWWSRPHGGHAYHAYPPQAAVRTSAETPSRPHRTTTTLGGTSISRNGRRSTKVLVTRTPSNVQESHDPPKDVENENHPRPVEASSPHLDPLSSTYVCTSPVEVDWEATRPNGRPLVDHGKLSRDSSLVLPSSSVGTASSRVGIPYKPHRSLFPPPPAPTSSQSSFPTTADSPMDAYEKEIHDTLGSPYTHAAVVSTPECAHTRSYSFRKTAPRSKSDSTDTTHAAPSRQDFTFPRAHTPLVPRGTTTMHRWSQSDSQPASHQVTPILKNKSADTHPIDRSSNAMHRNNSTRLVPNTGFSRPPTAASKDECTADSPLVESLQGTRFISNGTQRHSSKRSKDSGSATTSEKAPQSRLNRKYHNISAEDRLILERIQRHQNFTQP